MSRQSAVETWFSAPPRAPRVGLRLFCLPYAGGGASIFRTWARELPSSIHVVPVEYPGHGCRVREPLIRRVPELVASLADDIGDLADESYAILGHSMGALLGFELARELRRRGYHRMRGLVVCARSAPQTPRTRPDTYDLPDDEFIQEIDRLAGTPQEVMDNRELLEFILPSIRADFEVVETYRHLPGEPLECGITVMGGASDADVSEEDLRGWAEHTRAGCRVELYDGGHFFLFSDWSSVRERVSAALTPLIS